MPNGSAGPPPPSPVPARPRTEGAHWLKHAFAIDPPGSSEPTPEQRRIVDRICGEVVRRRLTHPALLWLEVSRPLNYVGSQILHFFRPILSVVLDTRDYEQFASFLERRESVDHLAARLEHFEDEHVRSREKNPESARERDDRPPVAGPDPPSRSPES